MKYYQLDNIGLVKISKHKNAKKIRISINGKGEIRVSIPYLFSYKNTIAFVHQKKDWIEESLKKVNNNTSHSFFKTGVIYSSVHSNFSIKPDNIKTWKLNSNYNNRTLYVPIDTNFELKEVQEHIEKIYITLLRNEARQFLPKRLSELARLHQFTYNKVFIKNQKSRWGSCSAQKNINLNLHLIRLPNELIDFILLHELCHTRVMNHSDLFYKELKKVCPNHLMYNKQIKKYFIHKFHSCTENKSLR